eukprot:Skav221849  [mRNA]  locus=scaffold1175:6086:11071:+ [translate_table: standard]
MDGLAFLPGTRRAMWFLLLSLAETVAGCTQSGQFDEAAFTASLYAGSMGGVSMGVLLVILASLPLCCGVMKEHSKAISTITISLGILTLAVPLLGSLSACGPFVETVCSDRCPGYECTQQEKERRCGAAKWLVGLNIVHRGLEWLIIGDNNEQ